MFIDSRGRLILEELALYQGRVVTKKMMEKYDLNSRQIDYSLVKINDYLTYHQMEKVIKVNGELIANFDVLDILSKLKKYSKKVYVLSEEERVELSLLLLIAQEQPLSLQDFIIDLGISKNTALKNMKNVKKMLARYKLTLVYSRNAGYQVEGKETAIRSLLRDVVIKLVDDQIKTDYLLSLLKIEQELEIVRDKMTELEKKLSIVYTDHRHTVVSLLIAIFLRRIQSSKIIEERIPDKKAILETQEYQEMANMFEKAGIPDIEMIYFTIYVLAIDISKVEDVLENDIPNLRLAIDELIDLFEKKACIIFFDRSFLIKMLTQHLKPAYYRLKYRLNLTKGFDETLVNEATGKEFHNIYQIVETCVRPIEKVFGKPLPVTELRLLTLIFAGEMTSERNEQKEQYRAAVVCSEGISVSRLLYLTLANLIPELHFLQPMSYRELVSMDSASYDLVIAPFYVETTKKLIIIDPVITQKNRNRIREKVLSQLYGFTTTRLSVERIMEIVRQHTNIQNEQQLVSNLANYMYVPEKKVKRNNLTLSSSSPNLSELFPKEHITKVKQVADWQEALSVVAEPLIRDGSIVPEYIEKIIENYTKAMPHIVFGKEIAIPHANAEPLVKQLAMSMLIIEAGVTFSDTQTVHIVILLATPDKQSHLTAMLQLLDLSAAADDVTKLITSSSVDSIIDILQSFC